MLHIPPKTASSHSPILTRHAQSTPRLRYLKWHDLPVILQVNSIQITTQPIKCLDTSRNKSSMKRMYTPLTLVCAEKGASGFKELVWIGNRAAKKLKDGSQECFFFPENCILMSCFTLGSPRTSPEIVRLLYPSPPCCHLSLPNKLNIKDAKTYSFTVENCPHRG